jgi:hypothetical protein
MKLHALLGVRGFSVATVGVWADMAAPPPPPASNAKVAPKAAAKKEEPMGKISGIEIKRGAGYMGIELVGPNFKLTFYDAKKKPMDIPPGIARAALRWPVNYRQGGDERAVLNPGPDGKSLTSGKAVRPPHIFRLFITLLGPDGTDESSAENYAVDFHE